MFQELARWINQNIYVQRGRAITITYDMNGRLVSKAYTNGSQPFTYNNLGRGRGVFSDKRTRQRITASH